MRSFSQSISEKSSANISPRRKPARRPSKMINRNSLSVCGEPFRDVARIEQSVNMGSQEQLIANLMRTFLHRVEYGEPHRAIEKTVRSMRNHKPHRAARGV